MIYITFIISLLVLTYSLKNFKIFSPINVLVIFNIFQLYTYYLITSSQNLKYYEGITFISNMSGLGQNYDNVLYFFSFCSLIVIFFYLINFFLSNKNNNIIKINYNITLKFKIQNYIIFFNIIIFLINIIFILDINIYKIFSYNEYLSILDFSIIEADFISSKLLIRGFLIPTLISCLGIYYIEDKPLFKLISIINFIFFLLLSLSMSSRYFPLFVLLNLFLNFKSKNYKINLLLIINILIFIISYILVLVLRGQNQLGLQHVSEALFKIFNYDFFNYLKILYFNLTSGAILFDLTLTFNPVYDFYFKLLSSLPSISIIDNFSSSYSIYNTEYYRVTRFNPFNSFGEAYHYGSLYFHYYIILFTFVIFYTSIIFKRSNYHISFYPVVFLSYMIIFIASQYNLRNVIKFLFINFLLSFLYKKKFIENN